MWIRQLVAILCDVGPDREQVQEVYLTVINLQRRLIMNATDNSSAFRVCSRIG